MPETGAEGATYKQYKCPHCPSQYTRAENLKRHLNQHINGRIPCPVCSKGFTRTDSLKVHIKRVHSKLKVEFKGRGRLRNAGGSTEQLGRCAVFNRWKSDRELISSVKHPPLAGLSRHEIEHELLVHYWQNLDPGLPIVHRGSFRVPDEYHDDPLTNITSSIGARYSPKHAHRSHSLYLYTLQLLERMSRREICRTRNIQALILSIYSGIFDSSFDSFKRSKNDLTTMFNLARECGLLCVDDSSPGAQGEPTWAQFISMEVKRRLSYSLYFIDAQISLLLSYPTSITHYEIKHILPCSDELWNAETEAQWTLIRQKEQFQAKEIYFLQALQHTLLYGKPLNPISSFGAMIILNFIHNMIRHTTQYMGLLETVPLFANDPFSRRAQLGNALNGLRVLIPKRVKDEPLRTMWDVFECTWNLAYIHLHLPDTVITSGIIEVTLDATIATAAAMAKPLSRQPPGIKLLKNDFNQIPYETHSLVASHLSFFLKHFQLEYRETNPSLTFMFYKVSLIAWQILNVSINTTVDDELDPLEYSTVRLKVQEERDRLQKKYLMERLSCDILSNIDECDDYSNLEFYENWCYTLLSSFNIWGIGKCAADSFTEMLSDPKL